MKAKIGDYIRIANGSIQQVVRIDGNPGDPLAGYEFDDGSLLADSEINIDDVLLDSEMVG